MRNASNLASGQRRAEIRRLTTKNAGLMDQLKRLSTEVDRRMTKAHLDSMKRKISSLSTVSEQAQLSEIECLSRMFDVYKNEIATLKARIRLRAGPERVVALEKRLAAQQLVAVETLKRNKEVARKIKELEKALSLASSRREEGYTQIEVLTRSCTTRG